MTSEHQDLLKTLLDSPATAEYSRIRYVGRNLPPDQQRDFLRGLYVTAVEAHDRNDWSALAAYLRVWEDRAVAALAARQAIPALGETPFARLAKPVSKSTFALVTTGGIYLDGQEPYHIEGDGDTSFRPIPKSATQAEIRTRHGHYDESGPREDVNCVFPLTRFRELEAAGVIGRLADVNYSFMGYIRNTEELMTKTAPAVALRLRDAGVDAVFLSST